MNECSRLYLIIVSVTREEKYENEEMWGGERILGTNGQLNKKEKWKSSEWNEKH